MAEPIAARRTRLIAVGGHPIYSILLPVPVVCFLGALLTDFTYLRSDGSPIWRDFSTWLLLFGLLGGLLAGIILAIDFFRDRTIRTGPGWSHLLTFGLAMLVETANIFIHERDGWTAVAGPGVVLSALGAVLFLIAAWLYRPMIGVAQ